jgi:hypothetical protein
VAEPSFDLRLRRVLPLLRLFGFEPKRESRLQRRFDIYHLGAGVNGLTWYCRLVPGYGVQPGLGVATSNAWRVGVGVVGWALADAIFGLLTVA